MRIENHGLPQKIDHADHADHAVHRRVDLMAHGGQERGFRLGCGFGRRLRLAPADRLELARIVLAVWLLSHCNAVHSMNFDVSQVESLRTARQVELPGPEGLFSHTGDTQILLLHHPLVPGGRGLAIAVGKIDLFADREAVHLQRLDVFTEGKPMKSRPHVFFVEHGTAGNIRPQ